MNFCARITIFLAILLLGGLSLGGGVYGLWYYSVTHVFAEQDECTIVSYNSNFTIYNPSPVSPVHVTLCSVTATMVHNKTINVTDSIALKKHFSCKDYVGDTACCGLLNTSSLTGEISIEEKCPKRGRLHNVASGFIGLGLVVLGLIWVCALVGSAIQLCGDSSPRKQYTQL